MNSIKLVLCVICTYILLFVLNFFFYELSDSFLVLFYASKVSIILGLLILHFFLLKKIVRSNDKKKANYGLSMISLSTVILLIELAFSFVAKSHHVEITYSSIIWQNRYYQLNSDGFRDSEISRKNINKSALVFIGDSYTAGYGTNNPKNRYSDIVGHKLSSKYEFYNLGVKATGLKSHKEFLNLIKNENKILIYQIFINDLDDYCYRNQPLYDIYSNFCKYDFIWAKSMFLLNYIYFTYPNKKIVDDYYSYFSKCNLSDDVINNYLNDLTNTLSDAKNLFGYDKIFIMIMPTLGDISASIKFESNVYKRISEQSNIQVIEIHNELSKLHIRERIVNRNDTHASIIANQLIANKILNYIE